ncbi:MAG: hypothetical protein Aurels2KO_37740 [Aureliella sp.]
MVKKSKLCCHLMALLVACLVVGCAQEKESLHEHEHDAPKHWPTSMAEAAGFIEVRVQQLGGLSGESLEDIEHELQDLVEWAPEVAADTDLLEKDWVPVYEMSEAVRKHLLKGDVSASDLVGDFEKLTSLLRDAHKKLNIEEPANDTGPETDAAAPQE